MIEVLDIDNTTLAYFKNKNDVLTFVNGKIKEHERIKFKKEIDFELIRVSKNTYKITMTIKEE